MRTDQARITLTEKVLAVIGLVVFMVYCSLIGILFHYSRVPETSIERNVALEIKGITVFVTNDEYILQALSFGGVIGCASILILIRFMRYRQK